MNAITQKSLLIAGMIPLTALMIAGVIYFIVSNQPKVVEPLPPLAYRIIQKEQVTRGLSRQMEYRVLVTTPDNSLPSHQDLAKTATHLWRDGNDSWDQFTAYLYLPGMNTHRFAYGVANFTHHDGLTELNVNEDALEGTPWYEKWQQKMSKMTESAQASTPPQTAPVSEVSAQMPVEGIPVTVSSGAVDGQSMAEAETASQ